MRSTASWFSIVGALIVAINAPISPFGFIIMAISNYLWIQWAISEEYPDIIWMNFVFFLINIVGVVRWIL